MIFKVQLAIAREAGESIAQFGAGVDPLTMIQSGVNNEERDVKRELGFTELPMEGLGGYGNCQIGEEIRLGLDHNEQIDRRFQEKLVMSIPKWASQVSGTVRRRYHIDQQEWGYRSVRLLRESFQAHQVETGKKVRTLASDARSRNSGKSEAVRER